MGSNHEKIEELIGETSDPIVRATLLVLQRIDRALDANTEVTRSLAHDLEEHRAEFRRHDDRQERERATLRGAWWAGVALFTVVQVLGGYLISSKLKADEDQNIAIRSIESRLVVLEYKMQGK